MSLSDVLDGMSIDQFFLLLKVCSKRKAMEVSVNARIMQMSIASVISKDAARFFDSALQEIVGNHPTVEPIKDSQLSKMGIVRK